MKTASQRSRSILDNTDQKKIQVDNILICKEKTVNQYRQKLVKLIISNMHQTKVIDVEHSAL